MPFYQRNSYWRMIRIIKGQAPDILVKKAVIWTNVLLQARAREIATPNAETKRSRENAEKKYNHEKIKNALKSIFCDKCAYCESKIAHVSFGDIEHFRPKALYPELCFEWTNLLLACGVCNNNKLAQFPTTEDERLVDPTHEAPDDFFDFEYDGYAQLANVLPKNSRGEKTESIIKLNRPDLLRVRSSEIKKIVALAIFAKNGNPDAAALIQECCLSSSHYAAFSRVIARNYGLI